VASDFDNLPITQGTGPYHISRFRVYFRRAGSSATPKRLGADFERRFPTFFNGGGNAASVQWGAKHYDGYPTLQFTLDTRVPNLHDDWVYVCDHRSDDHCAGFAAQTLKRNFIDGGDRAIMAMIEVGVSPLVPPEVARKVVSLNQHHFLAGRRSWTICDAAKAPRAPPAQQKSSDKKRSERAAIEKLNQYVHEPLFFLDTAAIERSSLAFFELMEKYPIISRAMSGRTLRDNVVRIWCSLLANYARSKEHIKVAEPPADFVGWKRDPSSGVYYQMDEASSADDARAKGADIIAMHPALGHQLYPSAEISFEPGGGSSFGGAGAGGSW